MNDQAKRRAREEESRKIKDDDDRLIPGVGMSRTVKQRGKVQFKDGREGNTEIKFVRTRNPQGGVDVRMELTEPLGLHGEAEQVGG